MDAAVRDQVLALPEVASAAVIAAYVSIRDEPPTGALLDALRANGVRVLLPILQPDWDLEWAAYDGPDSLRTTAMGIVEPTTAVLGREAIGEATVVLVPALAVDEDGHRLGRGGGAYDRALRRASGLTVALVYDDEVLVSVPVQAHDMSVRAAVTPQRTLRFG